MAAPRRRRHAAAMAASHELGRRAEAAVADFLRTAGWHILATNWRLRHKEIDIIAPAPAWIVPQGLAKQLMSRLYHVGSASPTVPT